MEEKTRRHLTLDSFSVNLTYQIHYIGKDGSHTFGCVVYVKSTLDLQNEERK